MKRFSKSELQTKGKSVAVENKVETLYATEDGQFFEPKNKSAAEMHGRENKLKVYALDFSNVEPAKTLNVEETNALIEKCETLEELEAYATDERKGVQKAYKAMKQMLEEEAAAIDAEEQKAAEKGADEEA